MPRHAIRNADPSFVPADVGERIREARQEQGLSLAQLAGTELTRGFISAVEHGRSSISIQALNYVARRLDLPMSHFLADTVDTSALELELTLDEAETALRSGRSREAITLLASL